MILAEEAVMHIHRGIEVSMALIVASGAREEFAPFTSDALSSLVREPHALVATTSTILRSTMRINLNAHDASGIRLFFGESVDFAFQLIGLFAIEPTRFAAPPWFDHSQPFKHQHTTSILLTYLDNRSCCLVCGIHILAAHVCPEVLIVVFPLHRTACLPLLVCHPFKMLKARLFQSVIAGKAGFFDHSRLTHREHREILYIQTDCHRDHCSAWLVRH